MPHDTKYKSECSLSKPRVHIQEALEHPRAVGSNSCR